MTGVCNVSCWSDYHCASDYICCRSCRAFMKSLHTWCTNTILEKWMLPGFTHETTAASLQTLMIVPLDSHSHYQPEMDQRIWVPFSKRSSRPFRAPCLKVKLNLRLCILQLPMAKKQWLRWLFTKTTWTHPDSHCAPGPAESRRLCRSDCSSGQGAGMSWEICENAVQDFCLKQNLSFWARVWRKLEKLSEKVAPTTLFLALFSLGLGDCSGWLYCIARRSISRPFVVYIELGYIKKHQQAAINWTIKWTLICSCSWHDALWILWTIKEAQKSMATHICPILGDDGDKSGTEVLKDRCSNSNN